MSNQSGDEAAEAVAAEAVRGGEPGDKASAQTEGEIEHPHDGHTDSHTAEVQDDGSVETSKSHTYDDHSKDN